MQKGLANSLPASGADLQVSWHNESLKDDEKEQGCCTPSVLAVAMIPTKKIFVE